MLETEQMIANKINEYNVAVNKVFKEVSDDMNDIIRTNKYLVKNAKKTKRNMMLLAGFTAFTVYKIACKFAEIEEKIDAICDKNVTNLNESVTKTEAGDDLK